MKGANIKDYVTLFFFDESSTVENVDGSIFSWSIPVSYYSNQRSRVCSVSVVSADIVTDVTFKSLIIDYVNGGFNSYSSSNRRNIIGHLSVVDYANKIYGTSHTGESIQLLTNARPDKIRIRLLKSDNTEIRAIDIGAEACITLAFTYYDAQETNEQLYSQYTNVLK